MPPRARTSSLVTALEAALKTVRIAPEDAAAVQLARLYARELDEARVVSTQLAAVMRDLHGLNPRLHDRFLKLAVRVEQTTVAATIGPKLLAVLEQLGMTPAGRASVLGQGTHEGGGQGERAPRSKLDELKERRAARQHAAPAVD